MTDAALQELYQRSLASRTSGARPRCPELEAILALVRREGSEEERLATLDHVMSCLACQRELDLLRAIEAAGVKSFPGAATKPAIVRPLPWRRIVPLALAASLLVAVALGVRDRFDGRDGGDIARGETTGPALIAPADAAEAAWRAPLDFAWRSDSGATRYVLEVLDTGGRVVLRRTTSDTAITVTDTDALTSGVDYRWLVRAVTPDAQRASGTRRLRIRSQ